MKKKIIIISVLVLLVSLMFVLANDCTETEPCMIPSDEAIVLEGGKYYTFPDLTEAFQWNNQNTNYFYDRGEQRIEPYLERGSSTQGYIVVYSSGRQDNAFFIGSNLPPGTSPGTSPPPESSDNYEVNLPDGTRHQITPETYESFVNDCDTSLEECSIQGTNQYTTSNEQVIVQDDVIIRRNTETGTVSIGDDFTMTSEEYEALPFDPANADTLTSTTNSITYSFEEDIPIQTVTDLGWGLQVDAGGETSYVVGGERLIEEDGEWEYDGNEYSSFDSDTGTLRDGSDYIRFETDDEGHPTITEGSDSGETTTILLEDGSQIIEERKGGVVVSREREDAEENTLWEDQFTNGQFSGREFYDPLGRVNGWCANEGCSSPETSFNWGEPGCQYDDLGCYNGNAPEEFRDAIYDEQLWSGGLDWQETTRTIFTHSISFYPLANYWDDYQNYIEWVDKGFASLYLGVDYWYSAICEMAWPVEQQEGIGFIQTPGDTYQSVGHMVAEKISVGALLCDEEGKCPAELECRSDQFCYDEDAQEPREGYIYKIDWNVVAPRDEGSGDYGQEVRFNVRLYGENGNYYLFTDERGRASKETIKLEAGKSSSADFAPFIVEYSPYEFNKICIEWSDNENYIPHTLNPELFGGMDPIPDICDDKISEAQPGRVLDSTTDPSGVSRAEGIYYCGLNGC